MAITASSCISDAEVPLLNDAVPGTVDYKHRPVSRSKSGCWRSTFFIIGVEVAERFAYYGIDSNLINYLTGPLGQSTVTAAENVNVWFGTATLFPLLGGFLADSFLGRYRMIITASFLYILGLGLLTLSTLLYSPDCKINGGRTITMPLPCSPPRVQIILFFFSLYMVALAQGGHKPCVQAFGADQFDDDDPGECKAKSSFFSWWYFSICASILVSRIALNYIQDNFSWSFGFGIPCIAMCLGLVLFSVGTFSYRFRRHSNERNPLVRIGGVFVTAVRNWRVSSSIVTLEAKAQGILPYEGFHRIKFLNKALLVPDGSNQEMQACSINDIEEAKSILRLIPIWTTCLTYAIVATQSSTFFTKQGVTIDRYIIRSFELPAASLQAFINLSTVITIPLYDCVIIPVARSMTGLPSGLSTVQRIGSGLFLSMLSMVIAAIVERKRLNTAAEYGLVEKPGVTVPMSMWWLVPQYLLLGASEAFTMVGLQEFFYGQVPMELRSVGLGFYMSIFGIGNFLSSFLISVVETATRGHWWFENNLNEGHLDYFYWLLAGMSAVALVAYVWFAKGYVYGNRSSSL